MENAISCRPGSNATADAKRFRAAGYKVRVTASAELHDKLDRLAPLIPGADLTQVIEAAVTEKLERLEARRYGKAKHPERASTRPRPRREPWSVRSGEAFRLGARRRTVHVRIA